MSHYNEATVKHPHYDSETVSTSSNSSNYDDYIRIATENNLSMVLELDLLGQIKYISGPQWEAVMGLVAPSVGEPISNVITGSIQDKKVFQNAVEMMLENDNISYTVTFNTWNSQDNLQTLEACGILIKDNITNEPTYSMWNVKPYSEEWHSNLLNSLLPDEFIKRVGFGATIFADYLKTIETQEIMADAGLPLPKMELCRICETFVPAWWLETHSQNCVVEHRVESMIQLIHDNLVEQQNLLQNLLQNLMVLREPLQYKSMFIDSTTKSHTLLTNIFESLAELVEWAININTSEMIASSTTLSSPVAATAIVTNIDAHFEFSPTTKSNIQAVQTWQNTFNINELEDSTDNSTGLHILINDTIDLARKKVDAVLRLDNALKYSQRTKDEVNIFVMQLIREQIENNRINRAHSISYQFANNSTNSLQNSFTSSTSNSNLYYFSMDSLLHNDTHTDQQLESAITFTNNNNDNNSTHTINDKLTELPTLITPQPKHVTNNIFSESYMNNDELPGPFNKTSNSSNPITDNNSSLSSINNKKKSRSITPGTQMDYQYPSSSHDQSHNQSSSSNNNSNSNSITNSSFHTPVLVSTKPTNSVQNNLNLNMSLPKLSTTISLTPRRGSPLPSNLSSYSNQNQKSSHPITSNSGNNIGMGTDASINHYNNSIHSSLNNNHNISSRFNLDKSPISSPFAMARDYLTPEQFTNGSSSPNQPLSPLLLATNQIKSHTPSIKDYDILKPISKGAYGSVYLARKKLTGDYFAIKVLKKSDMIVKNQVTNVKSERAIMMFQSDKPYVAKLFATFQNRDNLFLVMEYLPGGDLATLIKMMDFLPDQWVKEYLTEIIIGVEDMHQNGIIHHDLKPDNLLIDSKGHIKLTDFGLSRAGLVRRHKNGGGSKRVNSNVSSDHSPHNIINNTSQTTTPEGSKSEFKYPIGNTKTKKRSDSSLKHTDYEYLNTSTPTPSMDNNDLLNLKRTDSQLSFSLFEVSRSSTPPPPVPTATTAAAASNTTSCSTPSQIKPDTFASNDILDSSMVAKKNKQHSNSISTISSVNSHGSDLALFHPEDSKQDKKFFGTPDYLAPETIEGTGEGDQCDWWSVGCIMFELLLGYPPFHANSPDSIFRNIIAGHIEWPVFDSPEEEKDFLSDEAKDLIKTLLVLDPSKRLGVNGAQEVKEHPYFRDIDWNNVYEEEPSFVPSIENPENTEYFDLRGAVLEKLDDSDNDNDNEINSNRKDDYDNSDIPDINNGSGLGLSNIKGGMSYSTPRKWSGSSLNAEVEHNPLLNKLSISSVLESVGDNINIDPQENTSRSSSTVKSMSLAIPPHMRERRVSKLNESQTEFGSFYFRNLSALDKANKDVINRLKNEHLSDRSGTHRRTSSGSMAGSSSDNSSNRTKLNKKVLTGSPGSNPTTKINIVRSDSSSIQSFSPDRSNSFDQTPNTLSRKGSDISNTEVNTPYSTNILTNTSTAKSPNVLFFSDSDSPTTTKFKSPLSPASYSSFNKGNNRNKSFPKIITTSHLGSSIDISSDETDRLQAVARVNSLRFRRRSGRKSSSTNKSDIGYHLDILVCEPIPIHRYRAVKDLENMGCTVVSAGAGDELVSKATSGIKFDLIMLPLKLVNFNVSDIIKLIKHTNDVNSKTAIIAITNYYQEAMSTNMFDDVLEKPIDTRQLSRILSKYLLKKSQEEAEDTIISDNDDNSVSTTH